MDNCCVCLTKNSNFVKINEIVDDNCISFKRQLGDLVPEVIWRENFVICGKCRNTLELIQEFRQQCLKSQNLREMEIKLEDSPSPSSSPNQLNSDNLLLDKNNTKGSPITCNYCGKSFKSKSVLSDHKKIHLNLKEYECKLCQKRFNTNSNLCGHNKAKHTDPKQWNYQCDLCSKRFPTRTHYQMHMKRHQKVKDFLCDYCEKNFCTKRELQDHQSSHTNFKAFMCDLCGIKYKVKRVLDIHLFNKHQISLQTANNFNCDKCKLKFPSNFRLQKHLRSHTGEKPFPCPLCDKRFIDNSYVKSHMKKMHNKIGES